MYCSCSNKNNYEVVSLCDIKKFTDKNGPFNTKPWTQISIADVLMLDCTKLAIEKIEKIYIDVSITSTKVIDTPISAAPNSEGMTLTGKKLLVDGFICSKIVYTSLTKEQSVYTSKFMVPFCTYIVIEPNANSFYDTYCVKTCIEDVFLSLIDCKTIFQNVTLFLLAEKNSIFCPNPQLPKEDCAINIVPPIPTNILPTIITLNALDNTPVVNIKFNNLSKEIIVDSTGKLTDSAGGTDYFKFTLFQPDGITVKKSAIIGGNENGMNFLKELSNTTFQNGDIVTLQTTSSDKVIVTNFPDRNTPKFTITSKEQSFKIGTNELVPHIVQEILFGNPNIAKISFNGETKEISVVSSGHSRSNKNAAMFLVKLRDGTNNDTIKANSIIEFNKDGSKFALDLNNTNFNFGDIIEVQFNATLKIEITNFPSIGRKENVTASTTETIKRFIKITEAGLSWFTPATMPTTPKLSNTIIIKSISTQKPMVSIDFNTLDKILDISYINGFSVSDKYFTLKFIRTNGTITQHTLGNGGTFGVDTFITNFSNLFFDYGDKIELNFTGDKSSVSITNFPNQGQDYTPVKDNETYEITPNGLILKDAPDSKLPNDIVINKPDGSKFGTIYFDTSNNKFALSGFKEPYDLNSDYKVLEFKLYHSNKSRPIDVTLNSNDNPDTFLNTINDKEFGDSYYLELGYSNKSKGNINITSFPQVTDIHTPTVVREYYKINLQGSLATHNPMPNTIYFIRGTTIATLEFDTVNKKIIPKQFAPMTAASHIIFSIKLARGGSVNKITEIDTDFGATDFVKAFLNPDFGNATEFDRDDFDYIGFFFDGTQINFEVSNYKSQGNITSFNKRNVIFTITGLE